MGKYLQNPNPQHRLPPLQVPDQIKPNQIPIASKKKKPFLLQLHKKMLTSISHSFSTPFLFSIPFPISTLSFPIISTNKFGFLPSPSSPLLCFAYNKQQQEKSVKKRPAKRRRPPPEKPPKAAVPEEDDDVAEVASDGSGTRHEGYHPLPPAGFVLDDQGRVLMASSKRIATIIDATNNLPLECVIRRVFTTSQGIQCMLLCPIDTPVQILKSSNFNGWSAVNDDEVEAIIPSAAYALAKIHMHLVTSGFCYTARGGFCYSEEDVLEFRTDDGEAIDGLPTEGVEITCFSLDGAHYMIYTPSDPLLFVAVKDKNGLLRIADDDLLEDSAIIGAIDEETEFNALVEEEAALLESLQGER